MLERANEAGVVYPILAVSHLLKALAHLLL
jgi:hypothetical protein